MLYYNNRPVTPARRSMTERFFQWRTFQSDTQELREKIEADFKSVKSDTRQEKYFLIPGRRNVMPRMIDDTTFEIRSKLNDNEPVELWERSISTSFPLKRTTSATIGSAIDGQVQYSIALQSEDKEAILDIIKAYGLKQADNTNIADHLLTA